MAITLVRPTSLRLPFAILVLIFAACSSSGASEDEPGDGSEQVDGETPGAAGMGDDEPAPGTGGAESVDPGLETGGVGATGAVAEGGTGSSEPLPAGGEAGGGGGEPQPPLPPTEGFLRGEALVEESGCVTCHQANLAGFTVFPNITPDLETGIGSWTDQQIITAIRDGVDADGSSMCPTMLRYSSFSEDELTDLVEFLRGIPAVANKVTSVCPGHGD